MDVLLSKAGAAVLGLGLALAAPASAAAASPAAPAPEPPAVTVSVSPSILLSSTAAIEVDGQGLDSDSKYYAQQCGIIEADRLACDPSTRVRLQPDEKGAYTTPLTVHHRFVGSTSTGELVGVDCSRIECVVAVAPKNGGEPVTAALSFL